MNKKLIVLFLIIALTPAGIIGAKKHRPQGFDIIANTSVPVSHLSKKDIKRIYMGFTLFWDNEEPVMPALLSPKKITVSEQIVKSALNQSLNQYRRYWVRRVFSGFGRAPIQIKTPEALALYINATPGSIGLLTHYKPTKSNPNVKVIRIK
jgi:hypothetical protein